MLVSQDLRGKSLSITSSYKVSKTTNRSSSQQTCTQSGPLPQGELCPWGRQPLNSTPRTTHVLICSQGDTDTVAAVHIFLFPPKKSLDWWSYFSLYKDSLILGKKKKSPMEKNSLNIPSTMGLFSLFLALLEHMY